MSKKTKNLFLSVFCIFQTILMYSQLSQAAFDYQSEVNNKITLPKSPEAVAFEKYGNTKVSLHTGTLDIAIPIHTINGREFDIPISLTYDATGVKVEQLATNVGINWNLNVGGRISRIANGRPDDYNSYDGPYQESELLNNIRNLTYSDGNILQAHFGALKTLADGCNDLLIDIYSLNVVGISDYIVINYNTHTASTLQNPRINVSFSGSFPPTEGTVWTVTDEVGNKFVFGENYNFEKGEVDGIDDTNTNTCAGNNWISTSSWLLNTIISKNGLDKFNFSYNKLTWINKRPGGRIISKNNSESSTMLGGWEPIASINYDKTTNYITTQLMLSEITDNNNLRIANFTYKTRDDIIYTPTNSKAALDRIEFYKFRYNELENYLDANLPNFISPIYKTVTFNHSYFGPSSLNTVYYEKRLKLVDIVFSEGATFTDDNSKKYSFKYYGDDNNNLFPPTNSNAQDFLGLFNGVSLNQDLVPLFRQNGIQELNGANRNFFINYALFGTLKDIIYPTKGYTEFDYERHTVVSEFVTPPSSPEHPIVDMYCSLLNNGSEIHNNMSGFHSVTTVKQPFRGGNYKLNFNGYGSFMISRPECPEFPPEPIYDFFRAGSNSYPISSATRNCRYETEIVPTDQLYFHGTLPSARPLYAEPYFVGSNPIHNQSIYIPPGEYQVTIWSKRSNPGGPSWPNPSITNPSNTITITDAFDAPESDDPNLDIELITTGSPIQDPIDVQGFRIKTITDYSTNFGITPKVIASEKQYKYITEIQQATSGLGISSGKMISFAPQPIRYQNYTIRNNSLATIKHIVRTSAGIENNNHIVYSKVIEFNTNSNLTSGFTEHIFQTSNTSEGLVSHNDVLSYTAITGGKERYKIEYDQNKNMVYSESYKYDSNTFTPIYGGYTAKTDYPTNDFILGWFRCGSNPILNYMFLPPETNCFTDNQSSGSSLTCVLAVPHVFTTTPYSGLCSNASQVGSNPTQGYYSYYTLASSFTPNFSNLIEKTSSTRTSNNLTTSSVEHYNYSNTAPYLLQSKINSTTDALRYNVITNGHLFTNYLSTEYSYLNNNPEKISDILIKRVNNSGTPELLSHRNNTYSDIGSLNGATSNFLTEIKTTKGNDALESRVRFTYNSSTSNQGDGNLKESIQVTGTNTDNSESYIFGYNDMYPVAKITGMPYSSVTNNSSSLIAEIKIWSNKLVTSQNTSELVTRLTALRNQNPDAQITTYTYNPDKGITSETNPKGITTYYEYDELGRLKRIKDKDLNTLSESEYHYRP